MKKITGPKVRKVDVQSKSENFVRTQNAEGREEKNDDQPFNPD